MKDKTISQKKAKITINDKYSNYVLMIEYPALCAVILCIMGFFIYKFIIVGYDPQVFWLLGFIFAGFITLLAMEFSNQLVRKTFVRCEFDKTGITCSGFLWKKWKVRWDDICLYGVFGNAPNSKTFSFVYFSTDKNEKFHKKKTLRLNNKRILFQIREDLWHPMEEFMPKEIKQNIKYAFFTKKEMSFKKARNS